MHFEYIANSVSASLMEISVRHSKPIANAILTTINVEQAMERSTGKLGNKGKEACSAIVDVLQTFETLKI